MLLFQNIADISSEEEAGESENENEKGENSKEAEDENELKESEEPAVDPKEKQNWSVQVEYSVSHNYKGTPIFCDISSSGGDGAMKFLPWMYHGLTLLFMA